MNKVYQINNYLRKIEAGQKCLKLTHVNKDTMSAMYLLQCTRIELRFSTIMHHY